MRTAPTVGIIVNTYNSPDYLARVLRAIARQTSRPDEVVLADDGSDSVTRNCFENWQQLNNIPGAHAWQTNDGFRRSRILNLAIAAARAEYLVFLDGDTVPHPHFIADHCALATPQAFVQGHRALIERRAAGLFGLGEFGADRRRALLQGQLRGLKHAFRWPRAWRRVRDDLHGVRGCNLGIWRADLLRVNGYNEAFVGWGREDSELAARLMNGAARRFDVRGWALCYHLWHPPASRTGLSANDELLHQAVTQRSIHCERGLDQHLAAEATVRVQP